MEFENIVIEVIDRSRKEKQIDVIVEYSPISERYWFIGCEASVCNGSIRMGGAWFTLDERWIIK